MSDVTAKVRYINDEWKTRADRAFIYSKETRPRIRIFERFKFATRAPCMQRVISIWTPTGLYSLNATSVLTIFTMTRRFGMLRRSTYPCAQIAQWR
ncbi:MAG: hypothetical protein CM1200mP9_06950 [Gammaproteobacteria bacterium]|nr:MAG: hypothetical protein CM1200mP9_06950 [Gammaproteobacteria bacterium]